MSNKWNDNLEITDPRSDNRRAGVPCYPEEDESPHPSRDKLSKPREPEDTDSPALDFEPEHVPRPEQNQRYPPIVTIDGRVDTDIDHLMDDSEDDKAIEASQRRYPKPHVFSVIDGSIDDDVDSLANHDGTMEHTLVDAPKSFNPRDLKDVSAKGERRKSAGRANRTSLVTDRSDNKQNADISDEEDDYSRADDTPLTPPRDSLTCIDSAFLRDDAKAPSDRSGADEFGSASKESIRLNPKTPPPAGKQNSDKRSVDSRRNKKKQASHREKRTSSSENSSVETKEKYDYIEQETENESALVGAPYNRPTGAYTTYADGISVDDMAPWSGSLTVTNVEKCMCSPDLIRKARSAGDVEDNMAYSANSFSDKPLSDGEILDYGESAFSPTATRVKPLQQEFKSSFMQNEVMAHNLERATRDKKGLEVCRKTQCSGLNGNEGHPNQYFISSQINQDETHENRDRSANRSENREIDKSAVEKADVWLDRVKTFISDQNCEIENGEKQSYPYSSLAGCSHVKHMTTFGNKQSLASDKGFSNIESPCGVPIPAKAQMLKKVRIADRSGCCRCKTGVSELCFVCRSKENYDKKKSPCETLSPHFDNAEIGSSTTTNSSAALILDDDRSMVADNIAKENRTSNKMIYRNDQDSSMLNFKSDTVVLPFERQLERVSKHPRPSTIRGSLKAAIEIAEQSMSAAAKVAQALSLVIEATRVSPSLSNTSCTTDSSDKPRQRSSSPTSSRRSSSFPHQSLSEKDLQNKYAKSRPQQHERSPTPEAQRKHQSRRHYRCSTRSRSRSRRNKSSTREGRYEGRRETKGLTAMCHLRGTEQCTRQAFDFDDVRIKHKSRHHKERGRPRTFKELHDKEYCHKYDYTTGMAHESKRTQDNSREKHWGTSRRHNKHCLRDPTDKRFSDDSCVIYDERLHRHQRHKASPKNCRRENWSFPVRKLHTSPECVYMGHVAKCWNECPVTFDKMAPSSPSGHYIRSKIVGSSVDPNERDSEYDSIGFNDNARVYFEEHPSSLPGIGEQDFCQFDGVWGKHTKDLTNSEIWLAQRPSRGHHNFDNIHPNVGWSALPQGDRTHTDAQHSVISEEKAKLHDKRRGFQKELTSGPVPTVDDSYLTFSDSETRSIKTDRSTDPLQSPSRTTEGGTDSHVSPDDLSLNTRPYDFHSDTNLQSDSTDTHSTSCPVLNARADSDIKSTRKCDLHHRERPRKNLGRNDT